MKRSDWITFVLFVWGMTVAFGFGYQMGFNQGTDACDVVAGSELIGIPA